MSHRRGAAPQRGRTGTQMRVLARPPVRLCPASGSEDGMSYLIAAGLTLLNAGWLALVVVGLPGTWLMVLGTLLVAWWWWDTGDGTPFIGVPVLIAIGVVALAAEVFEFVAGAVGSRSVGGTRRGALGALLGAILGAVVGTFFAPVLGSLLGTCAGAAIGAWAFELSGGRSGHAALKSGLGAGVGRFAGTVAKLIAGAAIWITVAIAAFWP